MPISTSRNPGEVFFIYPGGRVQLFRRPPNSDPPEVFATTLDGLIRSGDRLIFETTGAEFPAFRAEIVFPPPVRLIQPPPSASPIPLRRDQPLRLQWEPSWATFVIAALYNRPASRYAHLGCVFVTAAGSGVIPAEALSLLDPGDAVLDVVPMEMNILTVGAEPLVVQARNYNYQSIEVHFRLE